MIVPDSFDAETDESIEHMFLVLEHIQSDLENLMKSIDDANGIEFGEDHLIIAMYNMLCAFNFLHTSNVMHRDVKPSNILIDHNCRVFLCDFGIARTCLKADTPDPKNAKNCRIKSPETKHDGADSP